MAKVIEWTSNNAVLYDNGNIITARAYKKMKKEEILVGDNVEYIFDEINGNIINKVLPRRNVIIRPNIANIEQAIITIAREPETDLFLLDKLLINCCINKIDVVLLVNKIDLDDEEYYKMINEQYGKAVDKIIWASAYTKSGIDEIKNVLHGKTSMVIGQSAVGKSSLLNLIGINCVQKTQELTKTSGKHKSKGKNSTRANKLFNLGDNTFVADTPGFSSADIHDIEYEYLPHYMLDFEPYIFDCKYSNCTHLKEGVDCGIYNAFMDGKINKNRYERFIILLKQLQNKWEHKYD